MLDVRETQNRLGRATTYGRPGDEGNGGMRGEGSGRFKTAAQLDARKEQRKRYQFDANASDDEIEDELDDNLDEISNITKSLKALGTAMGQELDTQNERIERITDKTGGLDERLFKNTQRVRPHCSYDVLKLTIIDGNVFSSTAQPDQVDIAMLPTSFW